MAKDSNYLIMQDILETLNEKWKLDFVSATSGNCCNTCGDLYTVEDTEKYYDADTFLAIKWYFDGMNYDGDFESQDILYIKYILGDLSIDTVCDDLEVALQSEYKVERPKDSSECIKLIKI